MKITVTITGGYKTDPRDKGRPVVLIAAALGVPPEVFREAFRRVKPAPAGRKPNPAQVTQNKVVLLNALSLYGVTNNLLDKVSDYYRYNPGAGELWTHRPAKLGAILTDEKLTSIEILDGGSGYSSTPTVSISGIKGIKATAVISFGKNLKTNGSITEITLNL